MSSIAGLAGSKINDYQGRNEMSVYPIPYDFINKIIELSWCDIRWGYEREIITSDIPIKEAERRVLAGSYTNHELELSFVVPGQSDEVTFLLKLLCSECEIDDDSTVKQKWLFIVLGWLWDNRHNFNDPLNEIAGIYADFSYPAEIEGFVNYMPPSDGYDPAIHTEAENINRLMENWRYYLERRSSVFAR